jgi:WD40 repeat protein
VAIPFFDLGVREPEYHVLAVWDLASGRKQLHSFAHLADAGWLGFWTPTIAPDGRLYVGGRGGILRLTLPAEPGGRISGETVHAAGVAFLDLSPDGRHLLVAASREELRTAALEDLLLLDLAANTSRRITTHGSRLSACKLSPSGRIIVTGDNSGIVRVGPATGGEPHLLLGHRGAVYSLAISPDERWIASSSDESTSIWPMPDVGKPPLHALPHAELLAKLDTLTNLRVVRDPTSSTGWKLDIGPFPGWKDVPTW